MYCLTPLAPGGTANAFVGSRAGSMTPDVVLKVIREPYCREPRVRHRFARECEILAQLDHPGLPSLIAAETEPASRLMLIYRYLPGQTLADHLLAGALCLDERIALADRLLGGLSRVLSYLHSHPKRFAHGDMAPRNILLGDDETVALIDLGTARTTLESPHDDDLFAIAQPAYLTPEQAQGDEWGTASDCYQLGLVLFEILAGRRYNPGSALCDCRLHAAAAEPPSRTMLEGEIGLRHAALIHALLSPSPFERPAARQLTAMIADNHRSSPRSP